MAEWQQMRAVFSIVAIVVGSLAVWAFAQTPQNALSLSPYVNLHALQQNSPLDLGFRADQTNPGFGGDGVGVDITFRDADLMLNCPGGAYVIAAQNGLLVRANLFCPLDKIDPTDLAEHLESVGFSLVNDLTQSQRRPNEWGRSTAQAFEALPNEARNGKVVRIPLSRWEREDKLAVSLGAAYYAPAGRNWPMLEVDISIPKTCLFALSVFTQATPGEESWNSDLVAPVRLIFADMPWANTPPSQRYDLAAKAAQHLCKDQD